MERCEILEAMTRTLYVETIMSACDDEEARADLDAETNAKLDAWDPGCGGEWMSGIDATEAPQAVERKALELIEMFEADNKRRIEEAGQEWSELEGFGRYPGDADNFGHYLVMMFLGHGVGLWDDVDEPVDTSWNVGDTCFDIFDWL